ncbi:hypothetical protein E5A74_16965 [Sphingomonas naasensis]|uniref:Uncharacterized protein n=2 Tax=Sphingomonas naasensis TaxID=1344951 RepID=A0A4S1WCG3_9SPHN|nr:hypothetical protein E5A74_16965 [Sphingomonas naasensis]
MRSPARASRASPRRSIRCSACNGRGSRPRRSVKGNDQGTRHRPVAAPRGAARRVAARGCPAPDRRAFLCRRRGRGDARRPARDRRHGRRDPARRRRRGPRRAALSGLSRAGAHDKIFMRASPPREPVAARRGQGRPPCRFLLPRRISMKLSRILLPAAAVAMIAAPTLASAAAAPAAKHHKVVKAAKTAKTEKTVKKAKK